MSLSLKSFLIILALLIGGCSQTADRALHVGNGTEPQGLDPHLVSGVPEHRILSTLFEGLVDLDPADLHVIPGVAESWDVSDDGTRYVFHLRENARWSNGDPITADDFVYTWQRMLTPSLGAEYAHMLHCIKNAKAFNEGAITDFSQVGVKALDARTLEVVLNNPTPYFLSMQAHSAWYPVHKPTIEKFGRMDERNTKWTRPGNLVGNGAYTLKRWVPNNVIEVVKNEQYWCAANVKLERIVFYPIDNQQTEERCFRTGMLQLTENVPLAKVPVYSAKQPDLISKDPYIGTYFYRINVTRPPLDDPRVRRALALALDRDAITHNVLTGGQQPARTYTVPDTGGYTCTGGIDYNVAEARRLLAEAGYPEGRGLRTIELLYNTSESHKLIAEAAQRIWKENLGISVSLVNQDWKVYLASQSALDYDISRASWIGDYLDPMSFLECFMSDNGNNRTGWASKEYDALIERATRTSDTGARHALFNQAEGLLLNEAPIVPVYHYTRVFLKSPRVKGWHSNLLGYISFKDLSLEEEVP